MTYAEAIRFLYDLQLFGTKPGLETTFKLAALAGNPQHQLRFIHVAGTNGKGSTCAMLESIYRAAGLRTGLFISPHLVAFGERIQVNRELISQRDIARLTGEMKAALAEFPADTHPTFFEIVTVMALKYFAEQRCDIVIWETGLGGRLDATNIVTPLASVITNIQFDHQAWLGDTLEKIAAEKAGIIKPGVPVITAVDHPGAFRVLFEVARKNDSPFILVSRGLADLPPLRDLALPLPGEHQRLNAAVATHTVRAVADKIPVSNEAIKQGLQSVRWSGRLQAIVRPGGRRMLLDGAHNPGGAESLREALRTLYPAARPTFVLGVLRDKDCRAICEILAPLAARILLAPVSNQRTAATAELAAACRAANPAAEIIETKSANAALKLAVNDDFTVVTGSLYLIGEVMELLELSPATAANERHLNEWNPNPIKP
jgi:dihydrofolate synthase/folylpolyglutamate synthase